MAGGERRFEGKVALVTGAGSGLGKATALRLASEGASVACVDLDLEAASATAKEAESLGARLARAFSCDVSDREQVSTTVDAAVEQLGALHVVVNCAGILKVGRIGDLSIDDFERILAVNLTGTFLVCRAAIPHLERVGGNVVNIASNAGTQGVVFGAAYCASKGGVVQLTKALALEEADRGVRVNAVAPGGMDTPMVAGFTFPADTPRSLLARISSPLGMAPPEAVAAVVAFVASDEASNMTGAIVAADGGASI